MYNLSMALFCFTVVQISKAVVTSEAGVRAMAPRESAVQFLASAANGNFRISSTPLSSTTAVAVSQAQVSFFLLLPERLGGSVCLSSGRLGNSVARFCCFPLGEVFQTSTNVHNIYFKKIRAIRCSPCARAHPQEMLVVRTNRVTSSFLVANNTVQYGEEGRRNYSPRLIVS